MRNRIVLLVVFLSASLFSSAQLKPKTECNLIMVDLYKGLINEMSPNADPEQIKVKLPCFTSFEKEGSESKCGGGIYYADKDFTCYTQRDYYVIGEKFKGKFSFPLLGSKRDDLFTRLGNPKLKDAGWDAYQMQYGTLIVYYNSKKLVNKIIMSTKSTDEIELCTD
jgi:hypothetical protein